MKSRFVLSFIMIFLFLVCSQESFSQKKKNKNAVEEERVIPKFSYSPIKRDMVASTGLTIALLNPVFINSDIRTAGSPWSDFAKAMATDVEELLTAKDLK